MRHPVFNQIYTIVVAAEALIKCCNEALKEDDLSTVKDCMKKIEELVKTLQELTNKTE